MARQLNSVSGFVLLAILWEAAPRLGVADPRFFPPFSALIFELFNLIGTQEFWAYLASTMRTWAIGLMVATSAGIIGGLVIGLVPGARRYTHSTIEFLRPIPSVALIPGVILIFGSRYQSGVVLITYAAFWQVLLQMLYGLNDVDAVARDTARSFRFSMTGFIVHVAWPTLLPFLFTGIRLAASIALVLAVTAEMVIGTFGIGRGIVIAQSSDAIPTMYALVIVTGLIGVGINVAARAIEKRVLRWHPSVRNATVL